MMAAAVALGLILQTRMHPSQVRVVDEMLRIYVGDRPIGTYPIAHWQVKPAWTMDAGRPCLTTYIGIEQEGVRRLNFALWTCLTDLGIQEALTADPEFAAWYRGIVP